MRIKYTIIIVIFFITPISIFSQDISGDWEGTMLQPNNGFSHSRYPFLTHIEQNGNKITGTNKITLPKDTLIYGITKFEGTFKNNKLFFKELNIISENRTGHSFTWCIKTGTLKYREDADSVVLEGDWTAICQMTLPSAYRHVGKSFFKILLTLKITNNELSKKSNNRRYNRKRRFSTRGKIHSDRSQIMGCRTTCFKWI